MGDWWARGTPLIRGKGELTAADFPTGGLSGIAADASITSTMLGTASVKSSNLGDASVLSSKLGGLSVATSNLAEASVLSSKLGALSVLSSNLGDASVLTSKLGASAVASENLTVNALRRSVVVVTPDPALGVAGLSSDYVLFRAPVPMTVTKVLMTPLVDWVVFSTSGEDAAVVFNANTSMAAVALSSAGGVTAHGVPKDFGALINASVAAGADIKFKLGIGGLADDPPAHSVQIDYVTTG